MLHHSSPEMHRSNLPLQGMMKGEALSQAYASADIFVMPSMTETLGFVVLEAMASGLAVVSVASLGLIDIVSKPGVNGEWHFKLTPNKRRLMEQPPLSKQKTNTCLHGHSCNCSCGP